MNRFILSVAVLSLLGTVRAESYVPHSYYGTMLHINNSYAHRSALVRAQAQQQQLMQLQLQRAQRGQQPTAAMMEQARRLQLRSAYHQQMLRSNDAMIRQGQRDSAWHYFQLRWGLRGH